MASHPEVSLSHSTVSGQEKTFKALLRTALSLRPYSKWVQVTGGTSAAAQTMFVYHFPSEKESVQSRKTLLSGGEGGWSACSLHADLGADLESCM